MPHLLKSAFASLPSCLSRLNAQVHKSQPYTFRLCSRTCSLRTFSSVTDRDKIQSHARLSFRVRAPPLRMQHGNGAEEHAAVAYWAGLNTDPGADPV